MPAIRAPSIFHAAAKCGIINEAIRPQLAILVERLGTDAANMLPMVLHHDVRHAARHPFARVRMRPRVVALGAALACLTACSGMGDPSPPWTSWERQPAKITITPLRAELRPGDTLT